MGLGDKWLLPRGLRHGRCFVSPTSAGIIQTVTAHVKLLITPKLVVWRSRQRGVQAPRAIQESSATHPHAMALGATVQTSVVPFPGKTPSLIL